MLTRTLLFSGRRFWLIQPDLANSKTSAQIKGEIWAQLMRKRQCRAASVSSSPGPPPSLSRHAALRCFASLLHKSFMPLLNSLVAQNLFRCLICLQSHSKMPRNACSNPFGIHRAQYTKSLRQVTDAKTSVSSLVSKGDLVCDLFRKKLTAKRGGGYNWGFWVWWFWVW